MTATDRQSALDHLFVQTHAELKRISGRLLRQNRVAGVSVTTLVNETWLKLARSSSALAESQIHFRHIVAGVMRQILVDFCRNHNALSRSGGQLAVSFDESIHRSQRSFSSKDILALNDALTALSRVAPRQALLVEGRFFGGLSWAESAESLQLSESTIMREWRSARAWLAVEINRTLSDSR